MLHEVFKNNRHVITVEDGCIMGGFGSAILEFAADHDYHLNIKRLGIPDRIVEHGDQPQLHSECNYDAEAIKSTAIHLMAKSTTLV